jgi:predicted transcriptional regulator
MIKIEVEEVKLECNALMTAVLSVVCFVASSCTKSINQSDLNTYGNNLLKPGAKLSIEGQIYTIEDELTNGMQAYVYKAKHKPAGKADAKTAVIKIPKDADSSAFAHPMFFNSYSNFTRNLNQRYFFHITSLKAKNIRLGQTLLRGYVSDFVNGTPLDKFIDINGFNSIEMESLASNLARLYKDMVQLSIEKKAYLSDVAKLDNIMVTDGLNLRIIDAIVIDSSIPHQEIRAFLNQILANEDKLKRIYMHWGFSALHQMLTDHDLYGHQINDVLRSYLYSYIKPADLADDNLELIEKIAQMVDNTVKAFTEDSKNPFRFEIKRVESQYLTDGDPIIREFAKALDDFQKFQNTYVNPDGTVNFADLDLKLPGDLFCRR